MKVDPRQVQELRALTGAGVVDCKHALEGTGGDLAKALILLKELGAHKARKKAATEPRAGIVDAYVHGEGRIGVLVKVHCETDFLAKRGRSYRRTKSKRVGLCPPSSILAVTSGSRTRRS